MTLPMNKKVWLTSILAIGLAYSCGQSEDTITPAEKYNSGEEQLIDEFGIEQVDQAAIARVLEISKEVTLQARSKGILNAVKAAQQLLAQEGKDGSALSEIEDFTIGQPLDGVGDYHEGDGEVFENVNQDYFACPPRVENATDAKSCVELLETVAQSVAQGVDVQELRDLIEQEIEDDSLLAAQSQEFKDNAAQYLEDLALSIYKFGAEVATIRAEYTARAEGLCDDVILDKNEIARLRGIREAETIIREMLGKKSITLAPQGGECMRIGPTGQDTQAQIIAYAEKYVEENPLECVDLNRENPAVVEAEHYRMEGIKRGIDAHTTTIWIGIFRNGNPWQTQQYTVALIDGCEPKDQITYTTSPLVVDLQGDGLELTTDRVAFDLRATGQPQKVTWAGKQEGFLALDLNGDGRITSGRELFGDRSLCLGSKCADGAAALALYDTTDEGGNGDGTINAKDEVFKALKVWVDRNQNGRSEASELSGLSDHGIRAINLKVNPMDEKVPGGRISLSLSVDTDRGPLTAYDVWFDNLASPGFSAPLF